MWFDDYLAMMPHQHNVHGMTVDGFEYLWDLSTELVNEGVIRPCEAVDDRLIAWHWAFVDRIEDKEQRRNCNRPPASTCGYETHAALRAAPEKRNLCAIMVYTTR